MSNKSFPNKDIDLATYSGDVYIILFIENALSGPFAYVGVEFKYIKPNVPVLGVNLDSGSIRGELL
jgi:hypothetical protein